MGTAGFRAGFDISCAVMRWISSTGRLRPMSLLWMTIQAAAFLGIMYAVHDDPEISQRPLLFSFIVLCVMAFLTGVLTVSWDWQKRRFGRTAPLVRVALLTAAVSGAVLIYSSAPQQPEWGPVAAWLIGGFASYLSAILVLWILVASFDRLAAALDVGKNIGKQDSNLRISSGALSNSRHLGRRGLK